MRSLHLSYIFEVNVCSVALLFNMNYKSAFYQCWWGEEPKMLRYMLFIVLICDDILDGISHQGTALCMSHVILFFTCVPYALTAVTLSSTWLCSSVLYEIQLAHCSPLRSLLLFAQYVISPFIRHPNNFIQLSQVGARLQWKWKYKT